MRVPVVDHNQTPLMPCTPAKARVLIKQGLAHPKRNKLGIFYIQLTYVVADPQIQPLAVGIDPGSLFEGYSVVGAKDTVLNLMVEAAPGKQISKAITTRRIMRGARRFRKWRRPARYNNRLRRQHRLPPSTRARWEAKARIVIQLQQILPLTDAAVEDVNARTRPGRGGRWNTAFSPVQVGKEHLYRRLRALGLAITLYEGYQTKALREQYQLTKTSAKDKRVFESHVVDAWVLASDVLGMKGLPCRRLWYVTEVRFKRRQLHKLQAAKGGIRKPEGGTRSLGLKRGTLVRHPRYGLVSVGGYDRKKQTISLHTYRTNKRVTQTAQVADCRIIVWTPYRSFIVRASPRRRRLKPLMRGALPDA